MRVLVTAGPTREPIDPVRFLSNRSSGRMGYSIAQALVESGHQVVLVSGPVALPLPVGVDLIRVESGLQMLEACQSEWSKCQALYAVAAVADFRPKSVSDKKMKRANGEGQVLELVPNPDIVATLSKSKGDRTIVGFALETHKGEEHAMEKLRKKGMDFVALNGPQAQAVESSQITLIGADGRTQELGPMGKGDLARQLVRLTLGKV